MQAEIGAERAKGKGAMHAALKQLTRLIYPPRCIACHAETDNPGGLCGACWAEIEFISGSTCSKCGTPLEAEAGGRQLMCDACALEPPPWGEGRAALIYGGVGRRVILQLKHCDRLDIAPTLAQWMMRSGGDLISRSDIIAPVPLHWSRLFKRRYNQSAELVRALAPKGKACTDLLVRAHATPSLDGKRRDERASILSDAIEVGPHAVSGSSVLLIDDVLTTGATLSACARALMAADAKEVNVLTLARVVSDRGA